MRPCASPLAAPRRIYKTRPSDQSLGGAGASASRPGTIAHFENRYCYPYILAHMACSQCDIIFGKTTSRANTKTYQTFAGDILQQIHVVMATYELQLPLSLSSSSSLSCGRTIHGIDPGGALRVE